MMQYMNPVKGKPDHIELQSTTGTLKADGKDLAYVTVRMVDKDGNLCPSDSSLVHFSVKGAGQFRATANGDACSLEPFQLPKIHLFSGQATVIVQASAKPGYIKLNVSSKAVKKAEYKFVTYK